MSKIKSALAHLIMASAIVGGSGFSPRGQVERREYDIDKLLRKSCKGRGFSGGVSKMREFTINGTTVLATDLKMAKKKYKNALNKAA